MRGRLVTEIDENELRRGGRGCDGHLKRVELEGDGELDGHGDLPHALLVRLVVVGVVGARQLAASLVDLTPTHHCND